MVYNFAVIPNIEHCIVDLLGFHPQINIKILFQKNPEFLAILGTIF